MLNINTGSLATLDPFNTDMHVLARRALVGAKVGFSTDLAHTKRVLVSRAAEACMSDSDSEAYHRAVLECEAHFAWHAVDTYNLS